MNEFVIMTDACCDLPNELAARYNIISIPMNVTIDQRSYECNINEEYLTFAKFYDLLDSSESAMSSAVSMQTFTEHMERELKAGRDILYISFSSGLSATYQNAEMAAQELRAHYSERKIYVVDSLCASGGEGLLVYLVAAEKANGADIETLRDFAERTKRMICHWFTVDTLSYLKRGGRISKSVALVGSLLSIKPILLVDREGRLAMHSKVRGVKHLLQTIVDRMSDTIRDAKGQVIVISHANAVERARELALLIKERFPEIKEVIISHIGPTIGCHAGPGALALFFKGKMPA
ncbi:MAG: DegV family protein [Oscillospiraceae bacterium]|jgi:DegV family protein with EDD domain|nr:DegV family protein [Oscillospiraceae bacterium]